MMTKVGRGSETGRALGWDAVVWVWVWVWMWMWVRDEGRCEGGLDTADEWVVCTEGLVAAHMGDMDLEQKTDAAEALCLRTL
jgi:hypothetical protein